MPKDVATFLSKRWLSHFLVLVLTVSVGGIALAGEKEDMEAMQKALNQKTMERPFNPGDKAAVDAYVEESLRNGVIPRDRRPDGWAPGYTCDNLRYSLYQYRDCRYYHRYYGRYYPY